MTNFFFFFFACLSFHYRRLTRAPIHSSLDQSRIQGGSWHGHFWEGEKPDDLRGLIYIHYGYNMVRLMPVPIAWKPATVSLFSLSRAGSAFQAPSAWASFYCNQKILVQFATSPAQSPRPKRKRNKAHKYIWQKSSGIRKTESGDKYANWVIWNFPRRVLWKCSLRTGVWLELTFVPLKRRMRELKLFNGI